jgi:curved DNA-binding protein CbpA
MSPRDVLGVALNATDEEIRAAYVRKIKEFPPDRCPEEFEQVRDAYNALRDPRTRMRQLLRSHDLDEPLVKLFGDQKPQRNFVGPEAWLAALKGK